MDYKIVTAWSAEALEGYVQSYIQSGWKPLGGVAIKRGGFAELDEYTQAMVKE